MRLKVNLVRKPPILFEVKTKKISYQITVVEKSEYNERAQVNKPMTHPTITLVTTRSTIRHAVKFINQ